MLKRPFNRLSYGTFFFSPRSYYSQKANSEISTVIVRQNLLRSSNLKDNLKSCEYLHSALTDSYTSTCALIPDFKNLYLQKLFSIITQTNCSNSNEKCLKYLTDLLKIDNSIMDKKDISRLLYQIILKQSHFLKNGSSNNDFLKDIVDYLLILAGDVSDIHPQVVHGILKFLNTLPVNEDNLKFSNKIVLPIIENKLYLKTPFYTSLLIDVLTKQKRLKRIQELLPIVVEHLADKEQLHLKLFEIFVSLNDEGNLKELMTILEPTIAKYPQVMAHIIRSSDDPISKLKYLQPELKKNIQIIQYLNFSNALVLDLLNDCEKLSIEYLKEYTSLLNLPLAVNLDKNMFDSDDESLLYFNWKTNVGELMLLMFLRKKDILNCIEFLYQNTDMRGFVTLGNIKKIINALTLELNKAYEPFLKSKIIKVINVLTKRLNGENLVNRNHNRTFYIQDY